MNLLKISLLLFFIMPAVMMANDGYSNIKYLDMDSYKRTVKKPEFNNRFDSELDRRNFKKLREFLDEKSDLKLSISIEIDDLYYNSLTERISSYDKLISTLNKKKKNTEEDSIYLNIRKYERHFDDQTYEEFELGHITWSKNAFIYLSINDIPEKISFLNKRKDVYIDIEKERQNLLDNLSNVRTDINDCENQIGYALAPEYKRQEFRTIISGFFAALILFLLVAFFVVVYKKSDNNLSKLLLSGNGLQFITLFVLIIAIILFGILGILEGRELAAILSGISGYILGKGITADATTSSSGTVPGKKTGTPVAPTVTGLTPVTPTTPPTTPPKP